MGLDHEVFEEILEDEKAGSATSSTPNDRRRMAASFALQAKIEEELGEAVPAGSAEQLWGAIGAVFSSWMNARAITYRHLHNIPESWGTAVNVQAMVFGNMGDTSPPASPSPAIRRPAKRCSMASSWSMRRARMSSPASARRRTSPRSAHRRRLRQAVAGKADAGRLQGIRHAICNRLKKHYRDMQDLEFTIERGKLWMLQTRSGKRTAKAALKIAVEMAGKG
jgi:pyruvate,orthophosphate dikinase